MFHYVARAQRNSLLFRTWEEGLRLYEMVRAAFPEMIACCVMPDHLHLLLPHAEGQRRLGGVMSGYARYRNLRRATPGVTVWEEAPRPERVTPDKEDRNIRYVHLNPCRKHLVADPLSWPLSTHRDFVGLSAAPGRMKVANAERFHAYVSGDPTVDPAGTPLPEIQYQSFDFLAIRDAVSAITRTIVGTLSVRPLLVKTAAAHRCLEPGGLGSSALADILELSSSQIRRIAAGTPARSAPLRDPALAAAVRVVGDARFGPLVGGELPRLPSWAPFRGRR